MSNNKHILPEIPQHEIYTEAFAGGLAVFWAKEPSEVEVINDINGEIVNFYYCIKTEFEALQEEVNSKLHSRQTYDDSLVIYSHPHLFDKIRIINKKSAFNSEYLKRIEKAQIECNDANKVIKSRDTINSFHYVDTPYINSNQGHYSGYSEEQFVSTLDILTNCKGKFMLSSYPSEILSDYISKYKWREKRFEKQLAAGKSGKNRKVEVLTMNY